MKKFLPFFCLLLSSLFLVSVKAHATHAAGAEITYTWLKDSTYDITYHFYRDCKGIEAPDSVPLCYYNNCDGYSNVVYLTKTFKIIGGADNGTEVMEGCPGRPTTCAGGVVPGYQEWWYTKTVTLPSRCDHWTFCHAEGNRNDADNLISSGLTYLYVEATLNNKDDQGNSSAYFTVKPVPYICDNIPYTYNNGAFDPNGDSLYFECIIPEQSNGDCTPPFDETYKSRFSLPSNPLACGSSFVFSSSTGQMSFTPNATGAYALTVRVIEYKNISGSWVKVGTVMRDIQVVVLGCNVPNPILSTEASTLTGATMVGGTINACATFPLHFCFDITSDSNAVLVVTDNSKYFTTSTKPSVTYVNELTDSVRGCFSWTPGIKDIGLKVFTVSAKDSDCELIPVPISNTFVIPIYVWPVTKIFNDTIICNGDSATLTATGGGGFVWNVLPGGSSISSMSCTSCTVTTVRPTITTRYTVRSTLNLYCDKNKDTVTVIVLPKPDNKRIDTAACIGSTIQLKVTADSVPSAVSTAFTWTPSLYLSSSTISDPFTTPASTMKYLVGITYAGVARCKTVDTVNVKALKYFQLFTKDTSVCRNTPIIVNATGDPEYSYTWVPTNGVSNPNILNPIITVDSTRTYTVIAKHVGCPDSAASFTVIMQPTPLVNAGADKTICSGDTVRLSGSVIPSGNSYSYNWSPNSAFDMYNVLNPLFKATTTTIVVFSATTSAGCTGSDTAIISVINANFLHVSQDTGICPGDIAHLKANGDSIISYIWRPNSYMNDSLSLTPDVWPTASQYYTIYATNSHHCNDTASVHVEVHPAALVSLPDSVLLYPGDSYQMNPLTNCLYFQWFPPQGLSSTGIANPTAKPDVNTRYTLQARTEAGCITTDSINVYLSDDSYINVPNAFTPGSGPNAVLKVVHLGNATLKRFALYNRWGIKVFETSDVNTGWDGTFNGAPQQMGVYVYTLEAYTAKGKKITKQGNVTLLR
ncbi:MAG: gliding motility-associated C-terminal domain-containing protein [Flavipsychrobacter sp.]